MVRRDRWVELRGIMGNYGKLRGIMVQPWAIIGNYGTIMVHPWGIMGKFGDLWGIMGNYGELWGIILLLLVSFLFLLCSFPTDMSYSNFHAFNNVLYVRLSYLYKPPQGVPIAGSSG